MFQKQSLVSKRLPYFDPDVLDTCSISADESSKFTVNAVQFWGLGKGEFSSFEDF